MGAVVLALLLESAPVPDFDRALELIGERDFAEAMVALEQEDDRILYRRGAIELHYRAGDYRGALRALEAPLDTERETAGGVSDPWSLWRGAAAALRLSDGPRALELAEELTGSLDAEGAVDAAQLDWWRGQAEEHVLLAEELLEFDGQRIDALWRARAVSVAGLGLCLIGLAVGALQCRFKTPPPPKS